MKALRYEELAFLSNGALEEIFHSATGPPPETLAGYEWRGYNIAFAARLLGIQKFIKGFFARANRVEGYNIPAQQNRLTEPWAHQPGAENPKRYAFFVVTRVDMNSRDNYYPQALLLNYGSSVRNPRYGVERLLRDYLVQPAADNADLLLGKAYLALGPWRIFFNFFIIERQRASNWVASS